MSVGSVIALAEDSLQRDNSYLRGAADARVMLMLGDFAFSVDTTAYNQLTREAGWTGASRRASVSRVCCSTPGRTGEQVRLEGESHAFWGSRGRRR